MGFNADASALVYSTYLGGNGTDQANAVAVDAAGNAYVTGSTQSTNFPTASPFQGTNAAAAIDNSGGAGANAFVTKFNPAGSALVYSTYLGGSGYHDPVSMSTYCFDSATGIAVDGAGNAYVAGGTDSGRFPRRRSGAGRAHRCGGLESDAFVAEFNAAGNALTYSTRLGGSGADGAAAIAVDGNGSVYVAGTTDSTDFPTVNPLPGLSTGVPKFSEGFIAKSRPVVRAVPPAAAQAVPPAAVRAAAIRPPRQQQLQWQRQFVLLVQQQLERRLVFFARRGWWRGKSGPALP